MQVEDTQSSRLAVRARGITKCSDGVVALEAVDMDVVAGQIHGLLGPNGAGKTTLLGLLLGLPERHRDSAAGDRELRQGRHRSTSGGPGNDWRCTISWHLPGVNDATGRAIYQLDVNPNGRYSADGDGPQEFNGYFMLHTSAGDAPNPLWQFDGLVDLLAPTSKG